MNHFSSRGLEILTQYLSLLRRSARSSRFYLASLVPQSASFILTRSLIGMAHAASLSTRLVRSVYSFGCPFLRSSLGTAHAARLYFWYRAAALACPACLLACPSLACALAAGLASAALLLGMACAGSQKYCPLRLPCCGGGFCLAGWLACLAAFRAFCWPFVLPALLLLGWRPFRPLAGWLAFIRAAALLLPLLACLDSL